MSSKVQVPAKTQTASQGFVYSALIVGWLIPGVGHVLTGRWIRGLLLFVSIAAMFWLGIAMQGKLYVPNTGDVLDMLGFAATSGTDCSTRWDEFSTWDILRCRLPQRTTEPNSLWWPGC